MPRTPHRTARRLVLVACVTCAIGAACGSDQGPPDDHDTRLDSTPDGPDGGDPDQSDADQSDADQSDADQSDADTSPPEPPRVVDEVDPFIGTGGVYVTVPNCFPGAVAPRGMISPSPDTTSPAGAPPFMHAAGYHYDDTRLLGFSHNRLQGVSTPDMGALLLLPLLGGEPADHAQRATRTVPLDHANEEAAPGYYRVTYGGVTAELTASPRAAQHRYTFEGDGDRHLVFDLGHALGEATVAGSELAVDDSAGTGDGWIATRGRFTRAADDFRTWFSFAVDPPPDAIAEFDDVRVLTWSDVELVQVRLAISYVDAEGARTNLDAEAPTFDFDGIRAATEERWERVLSRVRYWGGTKATRRIMATALYHTHVMPTLQADADGRYRGLDGEVHQEAGFAYVSNLSMWDTYRTVHPLLSLVWPELQSDVNRSLVQMAEQGGYLPRWPFGSAYTNTTIGTSADIVLSDAWLRGVDDFDATTALRHMVDAATSTPTDGHPFVGRVAGPAADEHGFVPGDAHGFSVSRNLEYAVADGAIAALAESLGQDATAATFRERARRYANLWDAELQVFRPRRSDGEWVDGFDADAYESTGAFYGGNGRQHAWLVPHDLPGLAALFGAPERAVQALESLFETARTDRELLGPLAGVSPPRGYYHGNEPDLHAAWVFDVLGRPDLAQFWSDWVADEYYDDAPEGIAGNEDMGALSAWFVWSAMGLFPLPGSDVYLIGRPGFDRLEVEVEAGTLTIEASPDAESGPYVAGLTLDGEPVDRPWLHHRELRGGGVLRFELSTTPTEWGRDGETLFPVRLD